MNGQGSSDSTMSDEEFEDFQIIFLMVLHQWVVVMTPTGGNGMNVENLPDNIEGKRSTDNSDLKPKSSVQLSDRQKDLLKKKIEKQKKFLDGDIKKKTTY